VDGKSQSHILLRAREDVWERHEEGSTHGVVFGGVHGNVYRVPLRAIHLLRWLSQQPEGATGAQADDAFPDVDVEHLVGCGIVDQMPDDGAPVRLALVGKFFFANVRWRLKLSVLGWRAFSPLIQTSIASGRRPTCRPMYFDAVEAASRVALALPLSSRQCTVVAAATCELLIRQGYAAALKVHVSDGRLLMHARASVGAHTVEPDPTFIDIPETFPVHRFDRHE
jgi:hypothetical protein